MFSESKANILIVDDRPENLLAIESILSDLKQNLIRASSGREALRYLLENDFALILLDVQMPDLNGFELAEMIRERERTEHTPIIFISAVNKNEQYVFKGYSLGAVDYLTKPFEPEILRSKVKVFTELFQQNQEIKRQAELLEKANYKLDNLNSELEARVKERTAQLETANRELETEVEVRRQAKARLATEHAITRTLAEASNLEAAGPLILKAFCEHLEIDACLLWLINPAGSSLSCSHIEIINQTDNLAAFVAENERLNLHRGQGLPGQVWANNESVWVSDTINDDKFRRSPLAATIGFRSTIGFPIKTGKESCGVIELFTRRPLVSDQPLIDMIEVIGSEIGQFIQRKRAEQERENLLHREKTLREQAENASRLKDEFLATVSHELRTPLNSILGWSQMLESNMLDAQEQHRALEIIYRNAKAQAQLIDDLLDTSRLITGNLSLNLCPTSVVPIIESAVDVVRPAAEAKRIKLSIVYHAADPTLVCDSQRLQQMIWNLLTNAVKFTPEEGSVEVKLVQNSTNLQITVSDTGQGISSEFLPFVFERFRQADSSMTRKQGGLGLGLAIVRHLAELHGGSVQAVSCGPAQGSTFTITFPNSLITAETTVPVVSEEVTDRKTNSNLPKLNDVRVLVVDDDDDARQMMIYVLSSWGAVTQASASVGEALSALAEWLPDIILTDLSMPGEDGYVLLDKIRKQTSEPLAKIPVIALTAHAHPEESRKIISAGFHKHLTKPIDFDELTKAILHLDAIRLSNNFEN